ncbi:hypothetical protein QR680_011359 [Steinernema hermaphroditum]|uniref:Major facilitator superfamily (MFS) profile domain-containing protein n=1 Tax=Steinernema hermaphroditum TaxID=289476 RepID=A0AA39IS41_9BILA|nr:hypothetical protein QR680_011359 [Steinernema hermaphroditum]
MFESKKQRVMLVLCLIYGIWQMGTQWTSTLVSFLQWDTIHVMTIVDIGYIQSFGSLCNAVGALWIGQIADRTGPKTMFLASAILTSIYYSGLSFARCFYSFFFLQILRVGYQLESTAEMYLATVTTERERTGALMMLTVPQALAMFFGPMLGSKIAIYSSLRVSQGICGVVMAATLIPVLIFMLPETHSIPKLAAAKLRPLEYWGMVTRNSQLREGLVIRSLLVAAYVCYELIARNFLLRSYMKGTNDSAIVLIVMGASLLVVQFVVLPFLQRRYSPKTLFQVALTALIASYTAANFTTNLYQLLAVIALQTGSYAVAYAESCTQVTSSVELGDLGKAAGLGAMAQWLTHFIIPLYTSHLVNSWHYTYAFYSSAIVSAATLVYVSVVAKHSNARTQSVLPSLITAA